MTHGNTHIGKKCVTDKYHALDSEKVDSCKTAQPCQQ